jgi:hypothetical protein
MDKKKLLDIYKIYFPNGNPDKYCGYVAACKIYLNKKKHTFKRYLFKSCDSDVILSGGIDFTGKLQQINLLIDFMNL